MDPSPTWLGAGDRAKKRGRESTRQGKRPPERIECKTQTAPTWSADITRVDGGNVGSGPAMERAKTAQ